MTYYENVHYSQFDALQAIVRSQGCTPATGSNGADASTGGRVKASPDTIWNLIPISEQSNPNTPGWSLVDLDRAMARLAVPFTNRTGGSWADVLDYIDRGFYIALQGDCDQLGGCSGFLGDHALGVHPFKHSTKGQRCNEPTRDDYNYFSLTQLQNYAVKLSGSVNDIYFGTFDNPVPQIGEGMAKFVQANGYNTDSTKLLSVAAGHPWKYLDGTPGGTFSAPQQVSVFGLVDSRSRNYLAEIFTKAPYADGTPRTTLVLVESSTALSNKPTPPPDTDLDARQAQWDKDAASVIGPRPTV